MKRKIAIVVANPSVHPTLKYPVGFWASELFHPIEVFENEGIAYEIFSPDGGEVIMDPMSNPNDESQYSAADTLSKKYIDDAAFMERLKNTRPVKEISAEEFDGILVAGGQSPMFTFDKADDLHQIFSNFYQSGKATAALCHGVAVLNYAKNGNEKYLAEGKRLTGFSNTEEEQANASVNAEIMPWRIEDAMKDKGADFQSGDAWQSFTVVDGNLITGQQNMSGRETAEKIVDFLQKQ